jgi:hypothetical protein
VIDDLMANGDGLAVLSRDVPIRVIDYSASGCLLESRSPLDVGTVGTMRLVWQGQERSEDVRVARCQPIRGGSRFHIGVQFLATASPSGRSLRRALHRAGDLASAGSQTPM